jgi:histidine ammonia-lyase
MAKSAARHELVLDGSSLTIESLALAARDPQIRVRITPAARARVKRCRTVIDEAVRSYREKHRRGTLKPADGIYGITTGFGEFKTIPLKPGQLETSQQNILLSHSTGVGDNCEPDDPANYFAIEIVRAALIIRLNAFLRGHSGVRVELIECMLAMINRGIVPIVPTRGSCGSSGDLCPLAHTFVTLLGHGRFAQVRLAKDVSAGLRKRTWKPAPQLGRALGRRPTVPSFKEGLALTNGATFSAAVLALAAHDAEKLANTCDIAAALSLESVCGRTAALDPRVHAARPFAGQTASADNLRRLLSGSHLKDRSPDVQDAYSVRCAPQVHGASRDAIAYAKSVATVEINSATDNPLFFPPDRRAYSAGNFHGQPIGMAADFLAIALAELASISERRTQLLLDAHHNRGLRANLTPQPGINSGLMIAQYTAASIVSENKTLAHPASVDSIPTSSNIEDHVAMAAWASRKALSVLANSQAVVAIELLVAAQAVEWRVGPQPSNAAEKWNRAHTSETDAAFVRAFETPRPRSHPHVAAKLGAGTRAAYESVRRVAATLVADRVLADDIAAVRRLVADSEIVRAVDTRLRRPLNSCEPPTSR